MKMQIKEFSKMTGVSVRTLHYYDEIGLLKPSSVDEQNGYRYYDKECLMHMQEILFYRELDFPLKTIQEIISSPNYDKKDALLKQKNLLMLKKERLERLISAIEEYEEGKDDISMNIFDNSKFEEARKMYEKEARDRWGNTDEYKEFEVKSAAWDKKHTDSITGGMEEIFTAFASFAAEGKSADDEEVQNLVTKWQQYITDNFYKCTDEILKGLGQMYMADERFKENLDCYGKGTAKLMSEAISLH